MPSGPTILPPAPEVSEFIPITVRRLTVAAWLARSAGLLAIFGLFAAMASAGLTRSELKAGLPSWSIDCETFAQRLKYWYSFQFELGNSFFTPNEQHCSERLIDPHADPRVGVAYSIALLHRGARADALEVLEREAARGRTPAVHALVSLYLDLAISRRFGIQDPIDKAIVVLRNRTYLPTADSHFLLFKALNLSQRAENEPDAAVNLLKSLTLGSEAALFHLQSLRFEGERTHLQPSTKRAIKTILRELRFTDAPDDDFSTIEDYIALVKFIQAKPEFRTDDCIVSEQMIVCPQDWRWRFVSESGKSRLDSARTIDELSDILLSTAATILDVPERHRTAETVRSLKSSASLTYAIGALHARLRPTVATGEIHECDRLTAHPYDAHRTGDPVVFGKIDAVAAIAACDRAIAEKGLLPRYLFQRGRAYSKAQQSAADAKDMDALRRSAAAAKFDLEAAAKIGYPMAFNNLATDLENGADDNLRDKAASLHLEALSRTVHCCWPPVARQLLANEQGLGVNRTRRVVREFTAWSAALGSAEAKLILQSIGEPQPAPAVFADPPSWLRGP